MESTTDNKITRKVFAKTNSSSSSYGRGGGSQSGRPGGQRSGRRSNFERAKSEFDQKTINVRRVARVVAGGRRFSFSVAMVIGDKNGRVGVGLGKAGDTSLAINKAIEQAKKAMIRVPMTDKKSIQHEFFAKYKSARISLRPAPGHGLVAGSAVRVVLALAGLHDVNAKVISRSKNKLNIARATIKALKQLPTK